MIRNLWNIRGIKTESENITGEKTVESCAYSSGYSQILLPRLIVQQISVEVN